VEASPKFGLRGAMMQKLQGVRDPELKQFRSEDSGHEDAAGDSSASGGFDGTKSEFFDGGLVEFEPRSPLLGHLKLKSQRRKRMERVEKLTTLNRSNRLLNNISDAQRRRYEEVFKRYDVSRTVGLNLAETHGALADLGLKPSGRKDKLYIKHRLEIEGGELDFHKFCALVTERQAQIHDSERHRLRALFKQYDRDGSGSLSAEELIHVFADLQLSPEADDECVAFLDAVVESDVDGSGEIEWSEFEVLVQTVRQKILQCRREREVRIAQQMRLPADVFLNFRHVLVALHCAFRQYDHSGTGAVDVEDVAELIMEMGLEKSLRRLRELLDKDEILHTLLHDRVDSIDFSVLLQVLQRLRMLQDGVKAEDLRRIFDMYDIDHNGTISEDELLWMMRDLDMPDWQSHAGVSRLLEEGDVNGDGVIDYEEFKVLFGRVSELRQRDHRESERKYAETLGFDAGELRDMRELFSYVGGDSTGCLPLQQVVKVLADLGHPEIPQEQLLSYDSERLGRVDFLGFVRVMKDVLPTGDRRSSLRRSTMAKPAESPSRKPATPKGIESEDIPKKMPQSPALSAQSSQEISKKMPPLKTPSPLP